MPSTVPTRIPSTGHWIPRRLAGLLCALSLAACGGGDKPAPAPAPVPAAQAPAGVWSDTKTKSVLLVTAEGLAYGQLNSKKAADVVRGELLGRNNQLETSSFDAASLLEPPPSTSGQLSLGGRYQARSTITLNLLGDDGTPISLNYDAGHAHAIPLAQQAGTYTAKVYMEGYGGDYTLTIGSQGEVGLKHPVKVQCTAQGQLSQRSSTPGLTDLTLSFDGAPCMVPSGTVMRGLAIFDPAIRQFSAIGMNGDGDIGLYLATVP